MTVARIILRVIILFLGVLVLPAGESYAQSGRDALETSGIKGGLIVHLNCADGNLTCELHANDRYLVHGLDASRAKIAVARKLIRAKGLYGKVSVDTYDGRTLPYTDNLVNLVVAEELGDVPVKEVMRVLAPLGVLCLKQDGRWRTTRKPWPDAIDQWRQYLHGADNNAVARDSVVGPPRHLQWAADPAWSRSHMAIPTVISFNGIVLWKHDFAQWEPVTRYVKDIAMQLQRRLAAVGDTVYCTPGLDAPLTAFDAARRAIRRYR